MRAPFVVKALAPILALAAAGCQESGKPGVTWQGITGHSRYFQIAGTAHDPSAANAPVQCIDCHTASTTRPPVAADSFTVVTCTGCHNDNAPAGTDLLQKTSALHTDTGGNPFHQMVNGVDVTYGWLTSKCLTCHADGLIPHVKFPIGLGSKHVNRLCTDCHLVDNARADPTTLGCVKCHGAATPPTPFTKTLDAAHTGFLQRPADLPSPPLADADSVWCIRCHDLTLGPLMRVSAHSRDCATNRASCPAGYQDLTNYPQEPPSNSANGGLATGYPGDGKHGREGCLTCHSNGKLTTRTSAVPQAFGGTQPPIGAGNWAQSWSVPVCYSCH